MMRAFQYRLRPNAAQTAALEYILADSQETYNAALQERRDAWKLQRKSVTYNEQQAELTELRKDPRFAVIACDIQREPLRRVDRAFKAFFRRCKAGARQPGFPRFRSRDRYDSFAFNLPVVRERSIKIPNLGDVRAKQCRPLQGKPKLCTVKRFGKRWIASVVCDIGPEPEKVAVSTVIGIDVGLTHFVTLSDGQQVENPRWTRQHEARIAKANRQLATKVRGSKNRGRAKEMLRRAYQLAADARKNYCHHVSKWLVANYDLIAFEKLNISGMVRGHFAKSILDAAWGLLIWQISYKAEGAGRWAVPVNPRGTSQRCSSCGETVLKELWQRQHDCPSCGLSLDRDHNASLNILALGQSAAGIPAKSIQESGYSCI
jgi:putative transposase